MSRQESEKSKEKKKVKSGKAAVRWLLLYGKKRWHSHELQKQADIVFNQFVSESSITRYCREYCIPAIQPKKGSNTKAFTYIHQLRY